MNWAPVTRRGPVVERLNGEHWRVTGKPGGPAGKAPSPARGAGVDTGYLPPFKEPEFALQGRMPLFGGRSFPVGSLGTGPAGPFRGPAASLWEEWNRLSLISGGLRETNLTPQSAQGGASLGGWLIERRAGDTGAKLLS